MRRRVANWPCNVVKTPGSAISWPFRRHLYDAETPYRTPVSHRRSDMSRCRERNSRLTTLVVQANGPSSRRMSASEMIPTSLSPSTTRMRSSCC
jgi:hypothetical protein